MAKNSRQRREKDTPRGRCAPLPQGSVTFEKVSILRRRIRAKFSRARRTLFPVVAFLNRATILTLDTSLAIVTPDPTPEEVIQSTRKPLRQLILHHVHPSVRQHDTWVRRYRDLFAQAVTAVTQSSATGVEDICPNVYFYACRVA